MYVPQFLQLLLIVCMLMCMEVTYRRYQETLLTEGAPTSWQRRLLCLPISWLVPGLALISILILPTVKSWRTSPIDNLPELPLTTVVERVVDNKICALDFYPYLGFDSVRFSHRYVIASACDGGTSVRAVVSVERFAVHPNAKLAKDMQHEFQWRVDEQRAIVDQYYLGQGLQPPLITVPPFVMHESSLLIGLLDGVFLLVSITSLLAALLVVLGSVRR